MLIAAEVDMHGEVCVVRRDDGCYSEASSAFTRIRVKETSIPSNLGSGDTCVKLK
jgi:hypothetical protein